jgi:hypothetical protein
VSHHPPIGAAHADAELWEYDLVSAPKTKFLGNSVEVYPAGRTRIRLKPTGETFSLVPPPAKAHNLIVGSTWIESFGDYVLLNAATGAAARLHFTPCGWFGAGRYEVAGHVKAEDGTPMLRLTGRWNSHLDCVKCDAEGEPLEGAEVVRLWTCRERPEADPYAFTHFAHELNSCAGVNPLPSDSRRRPDRAALEAGASSDSAVAKHSLEEMQRAERKEREARGGGAWEPRWFRPVEPAAAGALPGEYSAEEVPAFEFTGEWLKEDPRSECPEGECRAGGAAQPCAPKRVGGAGAGELTLRVCVPACAQRRCAAMASAPGPTPRSTRSWARRRSAPRREGSPQPPARRQKKQKT